MTGEKLTDYIRDIMLPLLAKGEIEQLVKPSGIVPNQCKIRKTNMYMKLSDCDKHILERIIYDSIKCGIFALLVMIDGNGWFLDNNGKFELFFCKENEKTKLNSPPESILHELFNSIPLQENGLLPSLFE